MTIIPIERIASRIYVIRGEKVMVDSDLAELYGVSTSALNQQVRRNPERFPADFAFQLTVEEFGNLMSQNVISSLGHGGRRKPPFVFTEQGVAMLSGVCIVSVPLRSMLPSCAPSSSCENCLPQTATWLARSRSTTGRSLFSSIRFSRGARPPLYWS